MSATCKIQVGDDSTIACSDSTACTIKCDGDCKATCTGSSECAVTCGDAAAPATMCATGVFACGPC
jgi:hypothetical protein